MKEQKTYAGIDKDDFGGMTNMGAIVKDAWVFGIIPETETCEGWNLAGMQTLFDKTRDEWDKYGCLVSKLPPELRERHDRIYGAALEKALAMGWEPEMFGDDEKEDS